MTLSAYLVKAIYRKDFHSMTLLDIIDHARIHVRKWWIENRDITSHAERNFEMFTGLSFQKSKDDVLNGYADHYAEKAFASGHLIEEFTALLKSIRLKP